MNRRIVTITSVGHALCHIAMLALPVVLAPIGLEFGLSLTQVTGVGTAAYLLYGLGALPAGMLTRLFGSERMLLAYFVGIAGGSLLVGLAPNFGLFVAGMLLLGLAASIYHVAGPTLISHRSEETGRAFGIHGISGSGGVTIGPLVAGVMAGWLGWRSAYLVLAIPAVVGALLMVRTGGWQAIGGDRGAESARNQSANGTEDKGGREESGDTDAAGGGLDDDRRRRRLVFLLLMSVMMINGLVYRAALTVLPLHLTARVRLAALPDVVTGGVLASAVLAFGMAGMYTVGTAADRVDRFRLYAGLLTIVAPVLALMGITSGVALLISAIAFSVFYFPGQPVENSIIGTYVPPHLVSSIFGIKFVITFGLGSLGSVGAGYVVDRLGSPSVYLMLAVATVGSFTIAWVASVVARGGYRAQT